MADITGTIPSVGAIQGVISSAGLIGGVVAGQRGLKGDKGNTGDTGETGNGIASITKTGSSGLADTYTITYTDGTSTTYTVTNGADGQDGEDGADGQDGVSPAVTVTAITGGNRVTITDADHPLGQTFDVMDGADGADGQDGSDGADGYSPSASVSKSGNKATITITDKDGTTTADIYDGTGSGIVTDVTQNGTSVLDGTVAKVTVPTKVSDLTNDSGFITTETDPTVPSWAKQSTKPSYSYSEISGTPTLAEVATTGDYDDLDNKPTIPTVPTNVSAFTNDAGYLTSYTETDPTVPSWAKASNKPSYSYSEISGTPTLATVATTGDYDDLTDKPTIPTKTSDLTNDSGFLTSHQSIKTVNNNTMTGTGNVTVQETLVSGTNIKTVNSTSLLGSGNVTVQSVISSVAVNITVANWNATTSCSKSVTGVTASNKVIVSPAPASIADWQSSGVYCSAQGSGTLTFTCKSTPTASIDVNVLIIN